MKNTIKENYCDRFIEITECAVKETMNYLKSLKEEELEKSKIFFDSYQTYCIINEGSPEEGSMGYETLELYTISIYSIRDLLIKYLTSEKNTHTVKELVEMGSYTDTEASILNPQFTLFGFTFRIILEEMFKTEDINQIQKLNEISFDIELFNCIISEITDFAVKDELECEYYYFIFGPPLQGKDDFFNEEMQSMITIPNNKKREDLIRKFNFKKGIYGSGKTWEQTHAIMGCSGWISGKIRIKTPNFDDNGSVLKEVKLPSPKYIQEAFNLLSENIDIHFVSIPSNYNLYSIYIYPESDKVRYALERLGRRSFPKWLEEVVFFPIGEEKFMLDETNLFFIRGYPEMRMKLSKTSIEELIFTRYINLITISNSMNVILEACIILETLLTTEPKELGFQLRVKLAVLLGEDYKQKKFIQDVTKIIYEIRSDIVHNGGHKSEKKSRKLGGLIRTSKLSKQLVKLLLLRLITVEEGKLSIIKRDELVTQLDNYMIGEKTEINSNVYFEKRRKEFFASILVDQQLSILLNKHTNGEKN